MGLRADDWRLYRVRSMGLGLRAAILGLAAFVVLFAIIDIVWGGLEGPSGFRLTLVDETSFPRWGFQVQTQGEFGWLDLALFILWVPVLGLGVASLHQVDRLLASYQRGVIVNADNARRISRIGIFIMGIWTLLLAGDLLEAALSASSNEGITFEWLWAMVGLVFRGIGYAMGIACEIAEEAELTARIEQLATP